MATLKPGDCVLISDDLYMGTRVLLSTTLADWGVAIHEVDMTGNPSSSLDAPAPLFALRLTTRWT